MRYRLGLSRPTDPSSPVESAILASAQEGIKDKMDTDRRAPAPTTPTASRRFAPTNSTGERSAPSTVGASRPQVAPAGFCCLACLVGQVEVDAGRPPLLLPALHGWRGTEGWSCCGAPARLTRGRIVMTALPLIVPHAARRSRQGTKRLRQLLGLCRDRSHRGRILHCHRQSYRPVGKRGRRL